VIVEKAELEQKLWRPLFSLLSPAPQLATLARFPCQRGRAKTTEQQQQEKAGNS
jgi:hypothetical protein